jgi:hypothetical protein
MEEREGEECEFDDSEYDCDSDSYTADASGIKTA